MAPIYETLARKNLLYLITQEFASEDLDLHPDRVSNHDMGLIYEYLIRKFKEGAAAGEQYTPRDVVQLLVQLVFADVQHDLKTSAGSLVAIYDPACGTGGMITVAKDYLVDAWGLDPTNIFIYGQELREKTYAICKADALMKGDDGSRIKRGNTLSADKLIGQQFNFMMANPEFGTDWKKIESFIRDEAGRGSSGRFGAGLPDVGDASLLFLQHMISKMTPLDKGGSVIGIVFNGSPLFNGDAGSGWSDIRKWIITNDWLDAIVALPEDMFYNTNIATYLWIVRNNKPARRRGTITLINGNQERFRTLMRRNLGKKRVELTAATIAELVGLYREGKPVPKLAQVFDLKDFGYTRVTVERPLRLRFNITDEHLTAFQKSGYFTALLATKKVGDKARDDMAKGKEKQAALVNALTGAMALCPCRDDRVFLQAINHALPFKATAQLVTALRAAFGTTDETAEKVLLKPLETYFNRATAEAHPGEWYQTDSDLRDEERIPLKTNIADYFATEVLPYAPDAWMDRSKDKVGFEISFTKYFYEYQPPRDLKAILADLEALALLQEQRAAVIHRAVTKGLDPHSKMKPSGVEWLGDVPEEWTVKRLKFWVKHISAQVSVMPDGHAYLALEHVEGKTGRILPNESAEFDSNVKLFKANDILFGRLRPYLAKVALPDFDGVCVGELMVLRADPQEVSPRYLQLRLLTPDFIDLVDGSTQGAKMPRANWSFVGDIKVALPPRSDQDAVVTHIERETAKLDTLMAKYRRELDLLAEYRASLISHAVTGKIDVRGLVEPIQ